MGIMEIVRKGFGVTNKNIKLIAILLVFNVIGVLLRIPFIPATPQTTPTISPTLIILSIVLGLVWIFIYGGTLGSLKDFIKTQKSGLANFAKHGTGFYLKIMGVWILISLIFMVFVILTAMLITAGAAIKNLVVTVILLALGLIIGAVGVYVFMLLFMAPYILIADDTGPVAAIKKSVSFVRKSLVKMIGLLLVVMLVALGIGFIVGVIAALVNVAIKGTAVQLITGIVGGIFNAYLTVLLASCFLLFYMGSSKAEPAAPTA